MTTLYNDRFFDAITRQSLVSASVVLPILRTFLRPASVADVGCGTGSWLRAWMDLGVRDVLGIDGSYVDPERLLIPREAFLPADLTSPIAAPRRFDLAMSLEVAEHLPIDRAESFVADLCRLADVVLFSAAVPYQGGTGHVNENWPEYWAMLFARQGYAPIDCVRPEVWLDPRVEPWYRQNTLIFAAEQSAALFPPETHAAGRPLTRIHPELFLWSNIRGRESDPGRVQHHDQRYFRDLAALWASGVDAALPTPPRRYGGQFEVAP